MLPCFPKALLASLVRLSVFLVLLQNSLVLVVLKAQSLPPARASLMTMRLFKLDTVVGSNFILFFYSPLAFVVSFLCRVPASHASLCTLLLVTTTPDCIILVKITREILLQERPSTAPLLQYLGHSVKGANLHGWYYCIGMVASL